jgi:hypothetical protein
VEDIFLSPHDSYNEVFEAAIVLAEYIANSMATSIATFAVTSTSLESMVEFVLRVSGYTFFVDFIFKIFLWIDGNKESVEQPPWKQNKEEDEHYVGTSEPMSRSMEMTSRSGRVSLIEKPSERSVSKTAQ